jgi:Family of unknown function (DUF6527)
MKAFVLSESENYWSGFLLDKDCDSDIVRAFFPGTITEKKDDAETTIEAREECKTIVTSNERDFIRCIKEAQKREIGPKCEDCWGLVVLPNKDLQRKNALGKANRELTFDGETVSLDPSIGNWSFSCRSHYWIVRNQVRWTRPWSEKQIERGRKRDRAAKESFFIGKAAGHKDERTPASSAPKRDTEEEPRST